MKTKAKQQIVRLIDTYNEMPSKDRQEWLFGAISFAHDIGLITSSEAAIYCQWCGLFTSAEYYEEVSQ